MATPSKTPGFAAEQPPPLAIEGISSAPGDHASADEGVTTRPADGAGNRPDQHCNGATVLAYAAWTKLPEKFLRSLDLADTRHQQRPALRISYRDRSGAETGVRIQRFLRKDGPSAQRFAWRRGDRPQLYGLERLGRPEFVVLVESESDCHTLWYHDVPALGIPAGGTWNDERDALHVHGIPRIYVVQEQNPCGDTMKHWLARSRLAERAHMVDLAPFKDASALHCADPDGFKASFATALENARSFSTITAEARAKVTAEAWSTCQALATRPPDSGGILRCVSRRRRGRRSSYCHDPIPCPDFAVPEPTGVGSGQGPELRRQELYGGYRSSLLPTRSGALHDGDQ